MAGHSQFKNIMHRKGAQDAKRAKIFAKISREITVAARDGVDPNFNPRLRQAFNAARDANMPKDNVERALKKAQGGGENVIYHEARYEGYGPAGTAIIVEVLTDNKNRTSADVRAIFNKNGGNFAETGSVTFLFEHIGAIVYPKSHLKFDNLFNISLENNATDVLEDEEHYEVICSVEDFAHLRDALTKAFAHPLNAGLIFRAKDIVATPEGILKIINALEDHDDVQRVFVNCNIEE